MYYIIYVKLSAAFSQSERTYTISTSIFIIAFRESLREKMGGDALDLKEAAEKNKLNDTLQQTEDHNLKVQKSIASGQQDMQRSRDVMQALNSIPQSSLPLRPENNSGQKN